MLKRNISILAVLIIIISSLGGIYGETELEISYGDIYEFTNNTQEDTKITLFMNWNGMTISNYSYILDNNDSILKVA